MDRFAEDGIPFELFASFERIAARQPVFACEPPEWAAAAHAIVVGDTVHYLWGRRRKDNYWVLMHSTAAASDPAAVHTRPEEPCPGALCRPGLTTSRSEYPFPFLNPADDRFYVYYLGRVRFLPSRRGYWSATVDFGAWTRVRQTPVIAADTAYEIKGSSHPSVAVVGDTIHIIYTGAIARAGRLSATRPRRPPTRMSARTRPFPYSAGSGLAWDSCGVREAEIFRGPRYFHILYGGRAHGRRGWQIGHVRTRDFRSFEANPHNPIFTPSPDRGMWDCDGILTPQVFEAGDASTCSMRAGKAESGRAALPEQAKREIAKRIQESRLRQGPSAAGGR